MHDSLCLEVLLEKENIGVKVFADSAYRSEESEQLLQCTPSHLAPIVVKVLQIQEFSNNLRLL